MYNCGIDPSLLPVLRMYDFFPLETKISFKISNWRWELLRGGWGPACNLPTLILLLVLLLPILCTITIHDHFFFILKI